MHVVGTKSDFRICVLVSFVRLRSLDFEAFDFFWLLLIFVLLLFELNGYAVIPPTPWRGNDRRREIEIKERYESGEPQKKTHVLTAATL